MARSVFFSFHYDRDVHRVQLVRNVNALEGQPLLKGQEWEEVKRKGNTSIQGWINSQMAYKKAVIVLIGQQTATRPWVIYEIEKAWFDKKPLLGIRINGLSSFGHIDQPGANPFASAKVGADIPVFDPTVKDWQGSIDSQGTYNNLLRNMERWSTQGRVRWP